MSWTFSFLEPWWLFLLAVVPLLVWQGIGGLSGLGPVRRAFAIGLRTFVLVLIALALADMQFVRKSDRLCTLFVLDQSQSIPVDRTDALLDGITRAMAARTSDQDEAGLVIFGKEARLEVPPAQYDRQKVIRTIGSTVDRQYSDLSAGIKLALGSFPPDTARRIVLISDGNQNRGNVLAQAVAAGQIGVPIDVVPIEYRYDSEVLVDKIVLPSDLKKGDTANLKIVLRSSKAASGLLRLVRVRENQSDTVLEQRITLAPGLNVLFRKQTIDQPDFYTYEARFEPDPDAGDQVARNNQATAFTWIRGEGRVLLIEPTQGSHALLVEKLRADNLQVTTRTPDQVRDNLAELGQYDCVIVANVPAERLDERVQEILATNTRELGAGLIMLGGPDSFGAGGYNGQPIEKALPVDMEIKATKVRAKGALVLVMHASEIPEGNFWQKEIGRLAIKTLGPQDECGLVYWAAQTSWLFPLQPVGDRAMMLSRIDRMTPGDMPDFESSMRLAYNALVKSSAMTKHSIIISDGDPTPPSTQILQAYRDSRITISTVAVAAHGAFERQRMRAIAEVTKGRYYEVTNPKALPQIYLQETRIVSRPLIFEQSPPWTPVISYPTEPVAGMTRTLPPIQGYILTTPKPTAEVAIVSPLPADGDPSPILAHWQYGLGKSIAFTTDAGQRWAVGWPPSDLYGKFWSQLVRWSMRSAESDLLSVSTQENDGKVTIVVNAVDKQNEFLNFLSLQGKAIRPDMTVIDLPFRQTEPGKYEAEMTAEEYGTYMLRLGYRQPDGKEGFASTGLTVSYPPEYRDVESNRDLLENVATVSGGRVIPLQELATADFFVHDQPPTLRLHEIWPWLLLAALCVFLTDVAVRRIAIEPRDVAWAAQRVWAKIRRRPAPAAAAPMVERLRSVKAEVGEAIERKRRFEADPALTQRAQSLSESQPSAPAPKTKPPSPPTEGLVVEPKTSEPEGYTGRLLQAKKRVWDERKPPGEAGT